MKPITISRDSRTLVVGKTGSGKTTLARVFLQSIDRLIVIDSKFTIDPGEWQADKIETLPQELPDQFRYIVRSDDPQSLGEKLIRFSDYVIYIDELYAIFTSAGSASPGWRGLWTRGREYRIAVWAGVQRPVKIPLETISEADHYFCFRLSWPEDRRRMSEVMGVTIPQLPPRSFIYGHPATEQYMRVGSIEIAGAESLQI